MTDIKDMGTSELLATFQDNMKTVCTAIDTLLGEGTPLPDPRLMRDIMEAFTHEQWVETFLNEESRKAMRSNLGLMHVMENVNRDNRLIIQRMLRTIR